MKGGLRVIAGISVTAAMVVVTGYGWIIASAIRQTGAMRVATDWLLQLTPVMPAIVVIVGVFLLSRNWDPGHLFRWVFAGVLVTSVLYLGIPLFYLATRFTLLLQDGTAYWGLAIIPTLYVWLPAAIIGALTGIAISVRISGRNKAP